MSSSSNLLFGVGWEKVKAQVGLSLSRGLLGPWPGGRVKSGQKVIGRLLIGWESEARLTDCLRVVLWSWVFLEVGGGKVGKGL